MKIYRFKISNNDAKDKCKSKTSISINLHFNGIDSFEIFLQMYL